MSSGIDHNLEASSHIESTSPVLNAASNNPRRTSAHPRLTDAFRGSNKLSIIGEITEEEKKHDDTSSNRYDVLVLLFLVGLITGVMNGSVLWACKMISIAQSRLITSNVAGPFFFVCTTTIFCTVSALIIKVGNLPAPIGSGIAEVKSLMVNDHTPAEYPVIVSLRILIVRVSSLLFCAGSSLSVGVQGPLVHAAVCTAYCLARYIPDFQSFLDNPSIMKQVFAASAAVGLATVFNAPVGGLLFSVEVTSTYYLISNYWRSFMAASTGAIMYSIFLINRGEPARIFDVDYVKDTFHEWELPLFLILGVVCGAMCYGFALVHQQWILLARKTMKKHPIATAAAGGAITSALLYAIHAYSINGVSVATIVHDAFKDCTVSTMKDARNTSRIGGLFASLVVRMLVTILGTTLQISCGLFMPMLTIGSLIGRIFGQIVYDFSSPGQGIYVAGYAMVGAAAFVSGTTHTISCAVIVIEMTGQINMLLPCLIGSVIACGVNKSMKLSLYDQAMVNKGLESFELLLLTGEGFTDVMDKQAFSVTHTCQVADIFLLLESGNQEIFPVTDHAQSGKLIGSIDRRSAFVFIKRLFEKDNLASYIRTALPEDTKIDDAILQRSFAKGGMSGSSSSSGRFKMIAEAGKRISTMIENNRCKKKNKKSEDNKEVDRNITAAEHIAAAVAYKNSLGDIELGVNCDVSPQSVPNPMMMNYTNNNNSSSSSPTSMNSSSGNIIINNNNNNTITHRSYSTNSIASAASTSTSNSANMSTSTLEQQSIYLTPASAQAVEAILETEVDLAKEELLPINMFPFTIQEHTTMDQLYVLFEMVKVQCVFVLRDDGRLRGMINKDLLLQKLRSKVQ